VLGQYPDNGVAMLVLSLWFFFLLFLFFFCQAATLQRLLFCVILQVDGVWVDKGYLVQKAAEQSGHALLWHKLVARVPPGVTTFGKPSYHHMLCFSKVSCCYLCDNV
jgi:hypothetical protein